MLMRSETDGTRYLQFPSLARLPGIAHGVFTGYTIGSRQGQGRVSLNAGLRCGESDERVWANRRRMRSILGMEGMLFARQVHGRQVGLWANGQMKKSTSCAYLDGDALVTAEPGCALFIQVADCQPVMIVDPVAAVVANVHSGWRGSIQNIIGAAVDAMVTAYGCTPERMYGAIGPSLGPCCAEFIHYRREIPRRYWAYRHKDNNFNFWQLSTDQLVSAGLPPDHIETSGICTRCNPHLFFSYRAKRHTGRFAAVIGIRPNGREPRTSGKSA
jgi:polyphenol oxidase